MDRPLRILHLEDNITDSALTVEMLEAGGFSCRVTRVDTQAGFAALLEEGSFDLILADYTLPSFDGLSALQLATARRPEVPFIFVSGTLDEEVAIESLKVGATDYVFKTKMSRIVPSVRRALREAQDRARRAEAERALTRSESYLVEAQRLSSTGSFGWDPASGTIYWSEETYHIFGIEPGTPPTVELVVQRTHPDDRVAVQATIERAQRDGTDFEHKYRLLLPDGSVKHLHVVAHAVRDDAGRSEFVGAVMDVTERDAERQRADEEHERARRLELEQQSAIAAERTRLAGEIHDTLAQGLAMIVMQLADAEAKLGPAWALAGKPLGIVRELAVESLAYARRTVTMLQPSAPAAGLARAIRDVVESVGRHFGATLNFAVTGNAVLLPASVESALAGIAREALTNAARHSGAARVDVELAFAGGGAVRLAVADDGVGFDVENVRPGAYGLTSMQDRASRAGVALTFVTEPGAGTEVVASWSS